MTDTDWANVKARETCSQYGNLVNGYSRTCEAVAEVVLAVAAEKDKEIERLKAENKHLSDLIQRQTTATNRVWP